MKVGVLTSSRADFGIYLPLLKLLKEDSFFSLEIIAFGTHLSKKHGSTISEIEKYDFKKIHKIITTPELDSAKNIAQSIGDTISKFSNFWDKNLFDLVICLGDRYEMFAAVSASVPFNIDIAHIHAGETTLGAIDNAFRHAISLFSKILFVSTDQYKQRALAIVEKDVQVFNVGALSIDNLRKESLLTKTEFLEKFKIDLNLPTILATFHPETIDIEKNEIYINELLSTFDELSKNYQVIITLPNTDTMGQMIRDAIMAYQKENDKLIVIESFGMQGYLSCMKHCSFLLGNTSSGFVEASYFPKWVINLGRRQEGRIVSSNILNTPIIKSKIIAQVNKIANATKLQKESIYGSGNTGEKIIAKIKMQYEYK